MRVICLWRWAENSSFIEKRWRIGVRSTVRGVREGGARERIQISPYMPFFRLRKRRQEAEHQHLYISLMNKYWIFHRRVCLTSGLNNKHERPHSKLAVCARWNIFPEGGKARAEYSINKKSIHTRATRLSQPLFRAEGEFCAAIEEMRYCCWLWWFCRLISGAIRCVCV